MPYVRRREIRGQLIHVFLLALSFTLLGHVIWKNRELIHDVFGRKLDLRLLALAFACYFVAKLLTFVRWFWLVRAIEPSFRFDVALLLGFIGNLFNLLIPGAVGGDLVKAAYLAKMDVHKTAAIGSMAIDRLIGLLGLFIVAATAGACIGSHSPLEIQRLVMIVCAAMVAGAVGLVFLFSPLFNRVCSRLPLPPGRIASIVTDLGAMSTIYRNRPGVIAASLSISLVIQGIFTLSFYLIGMTLVPDRLPSLGQHLLIAPLIFFTMAVPLPFGAIGLGEEVSEQLFMLVAHPGGALVLIGFRVLMYGGALISAAVYALNVHQIDGWNIPAQASRLAPATTDLAGAERTG